MTDLFISILIVFVGIFAGIISVTVGSSALITIPFLMILGLNPYAAIATNKFSILSSFVTGGTEYYKKGIIRYKKLVLFLSIAAILGSVIGASLVLKINEDLLKIIIVILLTLVLLMLIFKREAGEVTKTLQLSYATYISSFVIVFLLSIYSGFFGAGFGTLIIFSLIYFFGFTFLDSSALMTIVNFFVLIGAIIIFAYGGVINYTIGIPLLIGTAIGGWIGAHYAVIKGSKLIKKLFFIITIILIIKLVTDLL